MKKLRNKLKASAAKRREGTGRTNPQEGVARKKKEEAKVYEEISRAVQAKASRPPVDMPPKKDKPFKPAVVGNNEDAKGFAAEVAATKPKPTVSAPSKPTVSAPSKPAASNTKNWGSQGPAPKATPDSSSTGKVLGVNTDSGFVKADSAVTMKKGAERYKNLPSPGLEDTSHHMWDAMSLGGKTILTAGLAWAAKKGTEVYLKNKARKVFMDQSGRVLQKVAAQDAAKKAAVASVKASTGKSAREATNPSMFTPKFPSVKAGTATPSAAKAAANTVVAPAAKAGTKKAGANTVVAPAAKAGTKKAGANTVVAPAAKAGTKKANDMSKLNVSAARGEARVTGNSSGNVDMQFNDPAFLRRDFYPRKAGTTTPTPVKPPNKAESSLLLKPPATKKARTATKKK